jgi:FkbM family methyltransferase
LELAFFDKQLHYIYSTTKTIRHQSQGKSINFQIHTPNSLCGYRADTFSTKEPETLAWIDEYGGDGALYDIGANIGLYSLYYAATKPGNVYSFEPSVFNLKLLAKNIHSNGYDKRIRIIPNPLTDQNGFANFSLSTIVEGGALSSFGVEYGQDGKDLNTIFRYQILGFSLDYLLSAKMIKEPPQLIKIDVDGIEHLILAGAVDILKNPNLKSVLIEVNDDFHLQATNVSKVLLGSGFYLREKQHSEITAVGNLSDTVNQIWCKKIVT